MTLGKNCFHKPLLTLNFNFAGVGDVYAIGEVKPSQEGRMAVTRGWGLVGHEYEVYLNIGLAS